MPAEREPRDLESLLASVRDALEGAIEWLDGPFVAHAERRKECRIAIIRLDDLAALARKQAERIAILDAIREVCDCDPDEPDSNLPDFIRETVRTYVE